MRPALRFLHDAAAAGVSDAELLRRYAQAKDEAAFELLVRRHADAVWAACRRVLPADPHAAEDAFQATFLALARKAHAVRSECAGGWLHRVAVHAALKLRRAGGDSPLLIPKQGADAPRSPDVADSTAASEVASLVHEELARLRESYRLPVVLCDLSGLTHTEAARQLGWPVGTVSGRLVRAREQLRRRLERRGVTLTAAGLSSVFAANSGAASPPVRTAVIAVAGSAPPAVVSLAEGVLSAMRIAKLKLAAAAVFAAVGLAGTGVMVAVSQEKKPAPSDNAQVGQPKAEIKEPFETAFPDIKAFGDADAECPRFEGKVEIAASKTDLRQRLAEERLRSLVEASKQYQTLIRGGQWDINSLFNLVQVQREIPQAAADVYGESEELIRWYQEWVSMAKGLERLMQARYRAGNVRIQDVNQVRAERFHAERELLKVMARVKAGPAK